MWTREARRCLVRGELMTLLWTRGRADVLTRDESARRHERLGSARAESRERESRACERALTSSAAALAARGWYRIAQQEPAPQE